MLVDKAIIFVAGYGKRLRPWTLATPKPLLNYNGTPLLERLCLQAQAHGIRSLWLNPGYLGQHIKHFCGTGEQWGMNIHYCDEPQEALLETGGTLSRIAPLINDRFWVLSGDVVLDWPATPSHTGEHVWLRHGSARDFSIKDGILQAEPQLTFSGVALLSTELVTAHPAQTMGGMIRKALERHTIHASILEGTWQNCNTPADFISQEALPLS